MVDINRQTFGSALQRPWALVKWGSNQPNGRRPGTSVAYLTDDEGGHYLGGYVEYTARRARIEWDKINRRWNETRPAEPARWRYRFKRAVKIYKVDVLHVFPHISKGYHGGPTQAQVRAAKKTVPVNQEA